MTIPLITQDLATEVALHYFAIEASTLGVAPGAKLPITLPTTLGNGQPFVWQGAIPEGWRYAQPLGCITLTVFND